MEIENYNFFEKDKFLVWFINLEFENPNIFKKGFCFGINFFVERNIAKKFKKNIKVYLPFFCFDNFYISKNKIIKDEDKVEFYVAFRSTSDLGRFFKKIKNNMDLI